MVMGSRDTQYAGTIGGHNRVGFEVLGNASLFKLKRQLIPLGVY